MPLLTERCFIRIIIPKPLVMSLAGPAACVVAAAGSRVVRGPVSEGVVHAPDDSNRGVHGADDRNWGVAGRVGPSAPRYSRGCGQARLPPEPRLLHDDLSFLSNPLTLLMS